MPIRKRVDKGKNMKQQLELSDKSDKMNDIYFHKDLLSVTIINCY